MGGSTFCTQAESDEVSQIVLLSIRELLGGENSVQVWFLFPRSWWAQEVHGKLLKLVTHGFLSFSFNEFRIFLVLLKIFYLFIFRERGREGERGRETSMYKKYIDQLPFPRPQVWDARSLGALLAEADEK